MAEKLNSPAQSLSLPKGGGAIQGIGETFTSNTFTGTGSFSVPVYTSPGRNGFAPKLALEYSSGSGNGLFGVGWSLSLPRVTRKTEKGIPQYRESDVFVLSGAEDLVPTDQVSLRNGYTITGFRPRTEGQFARIERWQAANGELHWRATTKENVTSIYGRNASARLTDPADSQRVYEWLIEETFDAHGNHILYEYSREDPDTVPSAIYEDNRVCTQLYIRRIFYGNTHTQVGPSKIGTDHLNPWDEIERYYLFEVVFDYGDLEDDSDTGDISAAVTGNWFLRDDPFSSYRAGFEIRTLRRCRSVVMYHHAAELGGANRVKSTDFSYDTNPDTLISFLASVTLTGYRWAGTEYQATALPPLTFRYSAFKPTEQHYQSIRTNGDALPPLPLSDPDITLVDLFGRGLPDLLHTSVVGFQYWKNTGGAFDRPRAMPHAPAGVRLSQGEAYFADLAGDGRVDLLVLNEALRGFYETTSAGEWLPLRRIQNAPTVDLNDRNARLLDLTGDGLTDVLVTRERHFVWYECLGEDGYAPPQFIPRVYDMNEFPNISFDDPTGRVRLADMTGDGLLDIVLLHNGRVDYWPNLGYGRFGRRVTMADTPRLERDFDPARLFLADLDGSGCTDLVYVESGCIRFWFNRSGNSWSSEQVIYGTPDATNQAAIRFADFFGMGTTAILWSYPLNLQFDGNYKVLDFCGGVKPHLLVEMDNHMGATTRLEYAASTRYALEDEKAGEAWLTHLPFPVQVVSKVEVIDHVSRTKLVTTYKYHHGYFDGREREFRGFGRVDRFDTEYINQFSSPGLHGDAAQFDNAASPYHLPPVETRTWFHTGIYFDQTAFGQVFDFKDLDEAYRQSYYAGDPESILLGEHDVETGITPHEAYRVLRGAVLRTEMYARDQTLKHNHPYQVTENRYRVQLLQPRGNRRHAVYHPALLESVTSHYERQPLDPRVLHSLNLEFDTFGNITDSVTIGYPRRTVPANLPEQAETKILYTHRDFINAADPQNYYYVGIPYQIRVFDVTGLSGQLYQADDFTQLLSDLDDFVPYHRSSAPGVPQKRIVNWTRTYFRADAQPAVIDPPQQSTRRLALGAIERLGLTYETYGVALTDGLMTEIYALDEAGNPRITEPMLLEGGYILLPDVANTWWVPGGRTAYDENQFYLSSSAQDAFGNVSQTIHDSYALLVEQIIDPLQNVIGAVNNYRVLKPERITDPNGNRSQVAFDALGLVVGTAVMGKSFPAASEGDSLQNFDPDLTQQQLDDFFNAADPHEAAADLLQQATLRIVYDLNCFQRSQQAYPDDPTRWLPMSAATLARESHVSDLVSPDELKIQISFSYSDGFGREIQKRVQAEPAPGMGDASQAQPRWVSNGWTISDNKGNPVRQFEPFFSTTHRFEFGVEVGVSPTLFYDPVERIVATLHPNHTYEKIVFDSWQQTTYDVNDTVDAAGSQTGDPRTDPDILGLVNAFFQAQPPTWQTWYAQRIGNLLGAAEQDAALKSAMHANTPVVTHIDALGRAFLTIVHNRYDRNGGVVDEYNGTRTEFDIEGNQLSVIDARNRIVMNYHYDMLGNRIHQSGMDAGERWLLHDVLGNLIYTWDSRRFRRRMAYDSLRRQTGLYVTENGVERLAQNTLYGEGQGNAGNHRTRVYQVFDAAGIVTNVEYDFKGNLKTVRRELLSAPAYKQDVDWSQNPIPATEGSYFTNTFYDALNRPTSIKTPDNSLYSPTYNEANLLDKVNVHIHNAVSATAFVANIDYNAKGQRVRIAYANGVVTTYSYDNLTFRLTHMRTTRPLGRNRLAQLFANAAVVQDLRYTYDPVGNITRIEDAALQTVFYNNQQVEPVSSYTYDALYRLIEATGREHIRQAEFDFTPANGNYRDHPFKGLSAHPNDLQALRSYVQQYEYDAVANLLAMHHRANGASWNQFYDYDEPSLLEPGKQNNRLTQTRLGNAINRLQPCTHDEHGNITAMPHLPAMVWDFEDRLRATTQQVRNNGTAETTYYVYDAGGQRVRKVTENQNGSRVRERIYLGAVEIFREFNPADDSVRSERISLHVIDDKKRIALVETEKLPAAGQPVIRYQLGNHLGSASLELDENSALISYEEYRPYGTTCFQVGLTGAEVSIKRYRYLFREHDEENGFYYTGARYYAAWLGRWISADPVGISTGINLYLFAASNPLRFVDVTGNNALDTVGGCYVAVVDGLIFKKQDFFLKSDAWKQSYESCNWGKAISNSDVAKSVRKDVASSDLASNIAGGTLGLMSGFHPAAPDGSDLPPKMQEAYRMMNFASSNASAIVGHFETMQTIKSMTPPGPPMSMAPAYANAATAKANVSTGAAAPAVPLPGPSIVTAMSKPIKNGGSAPEKPKSGEKVGDIHPKTGKQIIAEVLDDGNKVDVGVEVSKPSQQGKLTRRLLENPGHHDPSPRVPNDPRRPYNPGKAVMPADQADLFRNSIEFEGKRYAMDAGGNIHQFQPSVDNVYHWAGAENSKTASGAARGLEIPSGVREQLR